MKDATRIIIGILVGISFSFPLSAADFVKGEVIVKFKSAHGMFKSVATEGENRSVAVAVDDTNAALTEMKSRQDVEYAEPNYIIEAEGIPADWPYTSSQWTDLDLKNAWDFMNISGPGQETIVAVIDSGADLNHPDLAGVLMSGFDFANNDAEPEDDAGHGTKICGIIGALGDNGLGVAGVAWNANIKIMPLKFMKENEGKTTGNVADAVSAIYYAVDNGADIINASWGFTSYSRSLEDAILYARDHGVLFVASAGNSGQDNDANAHYPSNYDSDNIIAVAAMNGNGDIASFSNYGVKSVDIAAPGVGISSTNINEGYVAYASGTSFATPFVAAVAAMAKSQSPNTAYLELKNILITTATKEKGIKFDSILSGGCVNAYQTLLAEQSLVTSSKEASSVQEAPAQDTASQDVASSEGGGGGGGCMIDTSRNQSNALAVFAAIILLVIFRMPRIRHLE